MKDRTETIALDDSQPRLFQPITVRIRDACRMTGIGRSKIYELIKAGQIETIKIGTMTLLPVASIRAFLEQQAQRTAE